MRLKCIATSGNYIYGKYGTILRVGRLSAPCPLFTAYVPVYFYVSGKRVLYLFMHV